MKYPTISTVIPTYNSVDTIKHCIESVLEQTVAVSEIIIVNDGSTDNTESFLRHYKLTNNLDRLIIINQSNGGPAKARNTGIKIATGEWIAFLDADDRWLPDKIERQIEISLKHPEISIIGTEFFPYNTKHQKYNFKNASFTQMLFRNRFLTSTVLVKKNVVTLFYFDEKKRYSEDYKIWLQIIYSYPGIVISEGLVVYSENEKKYNRMSLSNQLWIHEKNELENFLYFYRLKSINFLFLIILFTFSFIKFLKRGIISFLQRKVL